MMRLLAGLALVLSLFSPLASARADTMSPNIFFSVAYNPDSTFQYSYTIAGPFALEPDTHLVGNGYNTKSFTLTGPSGLVLSDIITPDGFAYDYTDGKLSWEREASDAENASAGPLTFGFTSSNSPGTISGSLIARGNSNDVGPAAVMGGFAEGWDFTTTARSDGVVEANGTGSILGPVVTITSTPTAPEPSSLVLGGFGVFGLWIARRRRGKG